MKSLADCTPEEFLRRTVDIRDCVEGWLKDTDIMRIRRQKPAITDDMPDDAKVRAALAQGMNNFYEIIDAVAREHPEETLELLALLCGVEPENVNDHKMGEYMAMVTGMLNDRVTMGFFMSLVQLARMNILKV